VERFAFPDEMDVVAVAQPAQSRRDGTPVRRLRQYLLELALMEGTLLPVELLLTGMKPRFVAVERDPSLQIGQDLGKREIQAHDPLHFRRSQAQVATKQPLSATNVFPGVAIRLRVATSITSSVSCQELGLSKKG
jgi:hypothetical protein